MNVALEPLAESHLDAVEAMLSDPDVLRSMHFKQDLWEDGEIWSRLATDPAPE